MKTTAAIALTLLIFSVSAYAADTSHVPPSPGEPMQSLIKALSGTWNVTGSFEPGPEMPKGGAITGTQTWRAGPGNFTFMQEEDLHTPMGEMIGTGFMWWDQAKGFQGLRCLNMDPRGCDILGSSRVSFKWDGSTLAIDFASSKDPTKIAFHETYTDVSANGFTETGYNGDDKGGLVKALTIKAVRAK